MRRLKAQNKWSVIDPHVEPLKIARAADGSLVVDLHQVVKNQSFRQGGELRGVAVHELL
jgi:hypothetical protein